MKILKFVSVLLIAGFTLVNSSCSGSGKSGEENTEKSSEEVLTTAGLIDEAGKIGKDAFEKKYPRDSEIELEGEAKFPATWDDKIAVKFGPDMNNLPITADFMFVANGGSKQATDDKITSGENLHFKGKIGMTFFDDKGKLSNLTLLDCKVL